MDEAGREPLWLRSFWPQRYSKRANGCKPFPLSEWKGAGRRWRRFCV